MPYFFIQDKTVVHTPLPPAGMLPFIQRTEQLLPPLITALHRNFQAWGRLGLSPGPVTADRIWFGADGNLAFRFKRAATPAPLLQIGQAPELAAWLVLLDKWMETFVVIARARSIWTVGELGAALTFMTPAFLPARLVAQPPDNWTRVAQALALAVADGPLAGRSEERHWQLAADKKLG